MNMTSGAREKNFIVERMGPLAFHLETRAVLRRGKTPAETGGTPERMIVQRSRKVTLFGLPFPCFVATRERAVDDRRYRCDIRVGVRGLGYLLRYDGVLGLVF